MNKKFVNMYSDLFAFIDSNVGILNLKYIYNIFSKVTGCKMK